MQKHLVFIIIPPQPSTVKYRILRFWTAAARACARAWSASVFTLLLLTAGLTDNGTLPLWGTVLAGVVGLALVLGGVRDVA